MKVDGHYYIPLGEMLIWEVLCRYEVTDVYGYEDWSEYETDALLYLHDRW